MQKPILLAVIFLFCFSSAEAGERPNIVCIMLDDMGFSDLGCYGGEIHTPNIDRLAQRGLRFTQFYNAARCCPTRASLLTGLYPHQVGLKQNGLSLTRNGVTIAEALRLAGYQTAMTGKWHLSKMPIPKQRHRQWVSHRYDPNRPFGPLDTYPVHRGFDRHYGIIWGVVNYFDPFSLVDGIKPIKQVPDDYYITDAITEKSVKYIEDFAESDRPFFLYVAHCAPHWPLHARSEDIARYSDTYRDGWHSLRKRRFERQIELGLFDPTNTELPPVQGMGNDWSQLSDEQKALAARQMAVHAAMVDRVDQGVGRIVETLKKTNYFENTLIFVLSDNGAAPEYYPYSGDDCPSHLRDGEPIQYEGSFEAGPRNTWGYIGPWWANAANTPFRYWKKASFEGGCHTPLIVHWPAGLKTEAGAVTGAGAKTECVGHVIDIMSTCLDVSGTDYPTVFDGNQITPLEGKSLLPILQTGDREGHEALFFEHDGGRAVQVGDWKLVSPLGRQWWEQYILRRDGMKPKNLAARKLKNQPWELYNLSRDKTEMNNLAIEEPQRVEQLAKLWQQWANRVGALD